MANDRNAGRKPNTWESRRLYVPEPMVSEIVELIAEWKKKQRKLNK